MIRTERAHLKVAAHSHPGMTRKNNEDRFAVSAFRLSRRNPTPAVLAVLADGIGGHRGGEVAAEMGVEAISQAVAHSSGRDPLTTLVGSITSASDQIYTLAQEDDNLHGMGATCVCAWIIGNQLYTASVGDSRIYLLRAQSLHRLSVDHTWVQEAIEKGFLKPEEGRNHPNAHIIRRFLGSPTPPQVDTRLYLTGSESDVEAEANQGVRLQPGDRVLLCSDGLTDLVEDEEIGAHLRQRNLNIAAQQLLDLTLERGAHDNVTLITLEYPRRGLFGAVGLPLSLPQRRTMAALGCAGIAVIAIAAGLTLGRLGGFNFLAGATPTSNLTPTLPAALLTMQAGQPSLTPTFITLPSLTPSLPQEPDEPEPTYTPWPTHTRVSLIP